MASGKTELVANETQIKKPTASQYLHLLNEILER